MSDTHIAVKRAFVEIPEGQIHYRIAGKGSPILLLHMTNGSSAMYMDIIPLLAAGHRVIAMDTLGAGDSSAPPEGFQIKDYAGCVIKFLDAIGIGGISVLGHHTGAAIAVEVAASYPDRVNRLVASAIPDYTEEERDRRRLALKPLVLKTDGAHFLDVWHDRQALSTALTSVEMQDRLTRMRLQGIDSFHKTYTALFSYYVNHRLPLVRASTLLIAGDQDAHSKHLDRHKSLLVRQGVSAVTALLQGAGAFVFMEKAEEYARTVDEFLDEA